MIIVLAHILAKNISIHVIIIIIIIIIITVNLYSAFFVKEPQTR